MTYYVYMLKCSDNSIYTGITTDINRRIEEHNSGKGAKYTRGRTPVKLLHLEKFESKSEALKREIAIKKLPREGKLKLIEVVQK